MDNPKTQPSRPYFLPVDIELEALPAPVRAAMTAIVQPSYEELVVGSKSSLERSAGVTLTFLLTLEILDQFQLGANLNLTGLLGAGADEKREKLMRQHLRLVGAKQKAANFLMRIRILRAKRGPHYLGPPDA